ncbi:MAG: DUF6092 family protein [Chloroflexota bacterium]
MAAWQHSEDAYDLIGYMVSAAKELVIDPKMYGPFRLVDATSRFIELLEKAGLADDFMASLREYIDQEKFSLMTDEAGFIAFLDELVVRVAKFTRESQAS